MIDLDKVKYVLFDFDDTLCIHTVRNELFSTTERYAELFAEEPETWATSQPNTQMSGFIQELKKRNIPMGLCSAVDCYKHSENKVKWVCREYGIEHLDNYCCGSAEDKIKVMLAMTSQLNLKPENILIVDDYWSTIYRAGREGFQSAAPMEVVNWMNAKIRSMCNAENARYAEFF